MKLWSNSRLAKSYFHIVHQYGTAPIQHNSEKMSDCKCFRNNDLNYIHTYNLDL